MSIETNIHRESRLAKLNTLQENGYNPYPYRFEPNAFAADLQEKYKDLEAGTDTEDRVVIAGRAMAVRNSGMFIDVKDTSGKIQAFCHKNHLSFIQKIQLLSVFPLRLHFLPKEYYTTHMLIFPPIFRASKK